MSLGHVPVKRVSFAAEAHTAAPPVPTILPTSARCERVPFSYTECFQGTRPVLARRRADIFTKAVVAGPPPLTAAGLAAHLFQAAGAALPTVWSTRRVVDDDDCDSIIDHGEDCESWEDASDELCSSSSSGGGGDDTPLGSHARVGENSSSSRSSSLATAMNSPVSSGRGAGGMLPLSGRSSAADGERSRPVSPHCQLAQYQLAVGSARSSRASLSTRELLASPDRSDDVDGTNE